MTGCFVRGASVFGPGLPSWRAARPILRGEAPLIPLQAPPPLPRQLAGNERRRSGLTTRLALAVCQEAVEMAGLPPASLPCLFASSNGEGAVAHAILESLCGPDSLVSPTQFHNSVHNAPAGYWSIAHEGTAPVTCLACHDWTFAASLLQAAATTARTGEALLCVYDAPLPMPLAALRSAAFPFAIALLLARAPGAGALAALDLTPAYGAEPPDTPPMDPGLAALVPGNVVARGLRLLEILAGGAPASCLLALPDGALRVDARPC